MNAQELSRIIKSEALRIGFGRCGIARAILPEEEAEKLAEWLRRKFHGTMQYMKRNPEQRTDPGKILEGAKSVISVLQNYFPRTEHAESDCQYRISKYALGEDYHFVVKDKLLELSHFIQDKTGSARIKIFVDSAPVMDKVWAKYAGLGWIGKHTNLINPETGSFFFIGGIITDLELEYDSPIGDFCGTCTKCIEACPTQAIVEPYVLDASKCLSYLTIELKGEIPSAFSGKTDNWIFGCDVCQDVCPWNRFSVPHDEPRFEPIAFFSDEEWENMSEATFKKVFQKSALSRAKYSGLMRNIRFAQTTIPEIQNQTSGLR